MSLSATMIVWPDDEIKVVTVDGRWEEICIGRLDLWIGGDSNKAGEIAGFARLRDACNEAICRAQVRLDAAVSQAVDVSEALQEDAETDRATVAEWDATLPDVAALDADR
jgi:hypothetical protein